MSDPPKFTFATSTAPKAKFFGTGFGSPAPVAAPSAFGTSPAIFGVTPKAAKTTSPFPSGTPGIEPQPQLFGGFGLFSQPSSGFTPSPPTSSTGAAQDSPAPQLVNQDSPVTRKTGSLLAVTHSAQEANAGEPGPVDVEIRPRSWSPPPFASRQTLPSIANEGTKLNEYHDKRSGLLDILSSLHSTGIQQDLDLPQICVVGSQSVGKSSLIESMSGIKLPRDAGTCTRCPTECRLQYASTWSCKIVLRFHVGPSGTALSQPRDVPFGPVLFEKDRDKVERRLRQAQMAILHPTMEPTSFLGDSEPSTAGQEAQTFSQNCVCIRVAGPDVPDLYFYDLPGIIANVADGGNERDIKLIENLAKSFIDRPDCIILLVISCETDFENQGAGRLVLKNPSLRQRTIGVLTKVDRIEQGGEDKWLQILRNRENNLSNGWYCVKQPDLPQLRAGISWNDAKVAEKSFFDDTAPWSHLDHATREKLGSPALAEQLGKTLAELVSLKLPIITSEVDRQLRNVSKQLEDMPVPNYKDPRLEVVRLFRDFEHKLHQDIEGLPRLDSPKTLPQLNYNIQNALERFQLEVHKTTPCFLPWSSKANIDPFTQVIMNDLIKDGDVDASEGISRGWHLDRVIDLAKRSRTKELPGRYPFSVQQHLIASFTETWLTLAKKCFDDVRGIVEEHVATLIRTHFVRQAHSGMQEAMMTAATDHLKDRTRSTQDQIEALFKNELHPSTLNEHYYINNRSKYFSQYKAAYHRSNNQSPFLAALSRYPSNTTMKSQTDQDIETVMDALRRLIVPELAATDLSKLIPDDEMTPGLEIMAEVKAYFKVAFKRFVDNIKLQLETEFVQGLDKDLGLELAAIDLTKEQCGNWLREDPAQIRKREELTGKKERLESAQEKLASFVHTCKAEYGT